MTTITLTKEQIDAKDQIEKWFKKSNGQTFVLVGYAGTGKSTLVHFIIKDLDLDIKTDVAFAAYTGKASLVLTQKADGAYYATTIHRLIYNRDEMTGEFVLKDKEALKRLKLIIIDEASMVDANILKDLLSFGIKVLFLGDQGQLPPVGENHTNLLSIPDYSLTEILRQAADNPIIHLSMLAREGKRIAPGKYGNNVYVLKKSDYSPEKFVDIYMRGDQVICGYNKTRHEINKKFRQRLGYDSIFPQVGDKVICLKNNYEKSVDEFPLVNGMGGYVRGVHLDIKTTPEIKRDCLKIKFNPDFLKNKALDDLLLLKEEFETLKPIKLERDEYRTYDSFDFGYAITCHKSQGSQWGNIVLLNQVLNQQEHKRWLYTGITRASERLILIV